MAKTKKEFTVPVEDKVKTETKVENLNEVFDRQFIKPVGDFASLDVKVTNKTNKDKNLIIGKYLSFIFRRKVSEKSYCKDYANKKDYIQFSMTDLEIDLMGYLIEHFTNKKIIKNKDELQAFVSVLTSNYTKSDIEENADILSLKKDFYHEKDDKNSKTLKIKFQFKKTGSYYTFTGIFIQIGGKLNGNNIPYMNTIINSIEAYGILNMIKRRCY